MEQATLSRADAPTRSGITKGLAGGHFSGTEEAEAAAPRVDSESGRTLECETFPPFTLSIIWPIICEGLQLRVHTLAMDVRTFSSSSSARLPQSRTENAKNCPD